MIDLTVKTLDSLNHAFSLEDDQITVRGFKEHIAESVSIPASSQRLIYCGRVLQDDKKLNDYDVNGKVIHLVQRSPPQPGQRRNDNGQGQDQNHGVQLWQNPQRTQYRITGTQMHGNAMYLGATSVPAEIVEGHVHQLSSSTRLRLVTRLLDNANLLMGRLAASIARNPNCPNNLLSTSETSQPPSAQQGQEPQTDLLNDNGAINSARLREATNAVIAAATSAAGLSNTPLYRENSDNNVETVPMNETDDENQPQSHTQQSQPSQSEQQGSASNSDPSGERTLPQMAALLELLMNAQDCLRPYIEHYRTLMLEDPVLPTGGGHGSVEESQEIVNCVSKNLHSLSHACHALSDIIVDMSQEPPRSLRCRPSINPQATILQSGVPIQVEAHFSIQGQNSNNNNTNEESGQGTNMTAQSEGNETGSESNNQQSDSGVHQEQIHPPFGMVFNLPNDMVVMAVNPEGNIDFGTGNEHAQPGENNNNNNNDNNNGGRIGGATDAFSWSSMSTDFLRNAVEVVAGHIIHGGIAASALNTQNLPTGGQQTMSSLDGNTNAGQSTQARSNVGTHPTTSTQTRSTSRQQAYPLNVGMSIGQMYEFDPFFPCSSHHIRSTPSTFNTIPSMSQRPRTNQPSTTESPPQAQTATTSATTAATTSATTTSNTNSTNTTSNTNTSSAPSSSSSSSSQNSLTNLLKQALRVAMAGQPQPATLSNNGNNADGITQDELELARQFSFISTCPNLLAVLQGVRGLRTGDILLYTILGPRQPRNERNLFLDLTSLMLQNLTIDDYIHLRCGSSRPFANLRELVLEFLVNTFPYSTAEEIQEQTANQLLTQIRPRLESVFADEVINSRNGSQIDIVGTIESLLQRHIKRIVLILFNTTDIDGSVFGQETYNNLQTLKRQLHGVLRYSICGGKTRLRVIMIRLQTGRLQYSPRILGRWWREIFISSGPEEAQHQLTDEEIISLLVYQTPSSQPAATVPSEPLQQSPPAQVEAEPIETEVVEERITLEALAANDDEEIPETFPSHELLPSDWVPIIARDGVKQRRQLQTERVTNGGVTPFSDAYLGTLSTKRRKLIEQQKPRLLTSPMRNHGAISASVEHLVRESVTRAGVEVDRAAIGVAVDPDVRRAFGQAIRDCLGPRRFESPDFPDSTRFPNATKYFADQDRPPK